MITYCDHKVTATQLAKIVVLDKGEVGCEFWQEDNRIEWDTEREHDAINAALQRQLERVQRLLGNLDWTEAPKRSDKRRAKNPGR